MMTSSPASRGLGGERGDDVVGLEARRCSRIGMRERLEHLADQAHLLAQDVGRLLAVGLVGRRPARGGTSARAGRRPPRCASGCWSREQVDEHRREAEHRVGDLARRRWPGRWAGRRRPGRSSELPSISMSLARGRRTASRRHGSAAARSATMLLGDDLGHAFMVWRSLHRRLLDEARRRRPRSGRARPSAGPWPGRRPCGSRAAPRGSWPGRARACISWKRPSATSTAGIRSLFWNGLTR